MRKSILSLLAVSTLFAGGLSFAQSHDHDHDHSSHAPAKEKREIDIDHVFNEAPDDHSIGSETAPVSMIIYASVTCPHCSDWFTNHWPSFKANHIDNGDIRVTFREFPTAPAQLAMAGFLLANCGTEDQYFDEIVHQMQSQAAIFEAVKAGRAKETYDGLGQRVGLENEEAMTACFSNEDNFKRINRSLLRAEAGGIEGVPAFIVDGELYRGDTSAKGLSALIDSKVASGMTPMPGK